MKVDPRQAVAPFFNKTEVGTDAHVEGFETDLKAFIDRLVNRAKDKHAAGESSPLADMEADDVASDAADAAGEDEEEWEKAPVGPGGLDPNEVFQGLPEAMQAAFAEKDTEALKQVLHDMPAEVSGWMRG